MYFILTLCVLIVVYLIILPPPSTLPSTLYVAGHINYSGIVAGFAYIVVYSVYYVGTVLGEKDHCNF